MGQLISILVWDGCLGQQPPPRLPVYRSAKEDTQLIIGENTLNTFTVKGYIQFSQSGEITHNVNL